MKGAFVSWTEDALEFFCRRFFSCSRKRSAFVHEQQFWTQQVGLDQWFPAGGSQPQSGSRMSGFGVTNSSLSILLKSHTFRNAHIIILCYISKTESQTDFCEVRLISIIISTYFLLHSFNRPYCTKHASTIEGKLYPMMVRLHKPCNICSGVNTCQQKFQQSTSDIFTVIFQYYIH